MLIKRLIADFSLLCPPRPVSDNKRNNAIKQMNVLNVIVNSSGDLHCAQFELLKHPLIGKSLNDNPWHVITIDQFCGNSRSILAL